MKINLSALVSSISGKHSGGIARTSRKAICINIKPAKKHPNLVKPNSYKAIFSFVSQSWHNITQDQLFWWQQLAWLVMPTFQLFVKLNYNRVICGKSILMDAPAKPVFIQPNSIVTIVSKYYNSILFNLQYPIPSNYFIKIKATRCYKTVPPFDKRHYHTLCIINKTDTSVIDLMPYYSQVFKEKLSLTYFISFQISFIDSVSGFESKPFYYNSIVNNYFDILIGSGSTAIKLRRTSNNFNTLDTLDNPAGGSYNYLLSRFNDKTYIYIAYGISILRLTTDNGVTFSSITPGLSSLNLNDLFSLPNGLCYIYAITPKKNYISTDFGRTFHELIVNLTPSSNCYLTQISFNTLLFNGATSIASNFLFLLSLNGSVIKQCVNPINFIDSGSSVLCLSNIILISVRSTSTHSYILRSNDSGVSFTNVFDYIGTTGFYFFVVFDNLNLCAFNYSSFIYLTSSDAGLTWTNHGVLLSGSAIRDFVLFENGNVSICSSGTALIATSVNKGSSWSTVYSEGTSNSINKFLKLSAISAITFVTNSRKVLITTDSGLTWSQLALIPDNAYIYSAFLNNHS